VDNLTDKILEVVGRLRRALQAPPPTRTETAPQAPPPTQTAPPAPEPIRQIVLLLADPATVQALRPDASAARPVCWTCRSRRFWRSVHGRTVCARCHPPAVPELVAQWLEAPPEAPEAP
jgi:hypothetical protein